jgi:hypothetical protein
MAIATAPHTAATFGTAGRILVAAFGPHNATSAIQLDLAIGRLFWRWWQEQEPFERINPRHPRLHAAEQTCADAERLGDWAGLARAWDGWLTVVEELAG